MKDKKLQIFVSSTFTDLIEERQAAVEAILSSGHIPAGMELFSAGDESQMAVIKRCIDESDVYLLILGGRYGSIEPLSGKSYTHLEFEYAVENNKPLFSVVIHDSALDLKVKSNGAAVIETDNKLKLNDFKSIVLNKGIVKFWDDKKDIKLAIHETISDFIYRKDLVGWIRGDNLVNTGFLAEEIAKLTKENSELREKKINISNILYAGLTYSETQKLLENEFVHYTNDNGIMDLFKFFIREGFSMDDKKSYYGKERIPWDLLCKFKMVTLLRNYNGKGYYGITDDGHNFCIKAYLLNPSSKFINSQILIPKSQNP